MLTTAKMHFTGADSAAFSGWLVASLYACADLVRQTKGGA